VTVPATSPGAGAAAPPVSPGSALELRSIAKSFPGVRALRGVDLTVGVGEVHAVLGENGAGKSTLIKIASGALSADQGHVSIGGRRMARPSPRAARALGVRLLPQERHIVPDRSVAENVLLDRIPRGPLGLVTRAAVERVAAAHLGAFGIDVDPRRTARTLSVAEQQLVELARAVSLDARVVILDEPTASLQRNETHQLFSIIKTLCGHGVSVVFISHHLDEVLEVADTVTVLRDGIVAGSRRTVDTDAADLLELIFGTSVDVSRSAVRSSVASALGPPLVEVHDVHVASAVQGATFTLHAGEILALTGTIGSGASELASAVAGAMQPTSGRIVHCPGRRRTRTRAQHARQGVGLLPADRKRSGLLLHRSVTENVSLGHTGVSRTFLVHPGQDRRRVDREVGRLGIRCSDPRQPVSGLSGGNQQKTMLGRWLALNSSVLVLDEPTAGVDIASKVELYGHLLDAAAQGAGVLLVSSDYEEIHAVADRVLVLRGGKIVGEIPGADADARTITSLEMGT